MAITAESTSSRILLNINDTDNSYILQRAFYKNRTWLTYTENGFVLLDNSLVDTDNSTDDEEVSDNTNEEPTVSAKLVSNGDFLDSYELENGLYEYRYVSSNIENPEGSDYVYSQWIKYGTPDAIGYSFFNYTAPEGKWGNIITPDDLRYTYLWGTDFKATNGELFTDEQVQWFIDQALRYAERELNITIKKRVIKSCDETDDLVKTTRYKEGDYDDEENLHDFSYRKIQRYGMITTNQRPVIKINRLELINRSGQNTNLLNNTVLDKKKGLIKFLNKPYKPSNTYTSISSCLDMYGEQTLNNHLFYAISYEAGYRNSDEVPEDLREIIAKITSVSLLNVIGDGLMAGFSSSSLSMDGISESFSSTQSATSATFGARIAVYKDDIKAYIEENKYKFGYMPIGIL